MDDRRSKRIFVQILNATGDFVYLKEHDSAGSRLACGNLTSQLELACIVNIALLEVGRNIAVVVEGQNQCWHISAIQCNPVESYDIVVSECYPLLRFTSEVLNKSRR